MGLAMVNTLRNGISHVLYWIGHGVSRLFEATDWDWTFCLYCWLMRQSCEAQGIEGPWHE